MCLFVGGKMNWSFHEGGSITWLQRSCKRWDQETKTVCPFQTLLMFTHLGKKHISFPTSAARIQGLQCKHLVLVLMFHFCNKKKISQRQSKDFIWYFIVKALSKSNCSILQTNTEVDQLTLNVSVSALSGMNSRPKNGPSLTNRLKFWSISWEVEKASEPYWPRRVQAWARRLRWVQPWYIKKKIYIYIYMYAYTVHVCMCIYILTWSLYSHCRRSCQPAGPLRLRTDPHLLSSQIY